MKKFELQKIVPYLLISSMLLTGCGKKVDCNYPNRHVHLYTKYPGSRIAISTYFDSEDESLHGFARQEDHMDITKTDEEFYKIITRNGLFVGEDYFNYLYQLMASKHDYLKFYYEYETTEVYTETDSKGNTTMHTRTVTHSGWHDNPNDSDNTGKTRLYHHRYYGYRITCIDGKFQLERSPLVDDVRQILGEYPYVCENCVEEVYEQFKFSRSELRYLDPNEFDTFAQPDLGNSTPYLGATKVK